MKDKKIKADKIIFSNRKTLGIRINKDKEIIVRAPLGTSQKTIDEILRKYKDWIKQGKKTVEKHKHIPKKYINGEEFIFLGKLYPLEIIENNSLSIRFDDKFYLTNKAIPYGEKLFTLFYKRNTLRIVRERCYFFAQKYGLSYTKIGVTLAKTRWGLCSFKNNLNFSYKLAMAPMKIIDYIVVHELAHTIEKNHSHKFWKIVETIMPDYKEHRKFLRKNERFWQL